MSEVTKEGDRSADPRLVPEPKREQGVRSYEEPRLRVIGTFAELTRGGTTGLSDGLGPGSVV